MWQSIERRFAGDHPTAAGHFPSNPIIPGALLLDEVVAAIAGNVGAEHGILIRTAKFFRPVRPGDSMNVRWQSAVSGVVRFECRVVGDADVAVAGTLEIGPIAS